MTFSSDQQKHYTQKLMIGQSFNKWDAASSFHLRAERDLKEAQHEFDIAHRQALMSKSDTEIISDTLLFRGLVWMSSFSDYAHNRLYEMCACASPFVTVSCTDQQPGWENYPVLYFTLKQNKGIDSTIADRVQNWFTSFAQGRQVISSPVIYAQKGRFGQLQYEHDMSTGRGRVVAGHVGNQKVLLDNELPYCLRYITENWYYFPAGSRIQGNPDWIST